MGRRRRHLAAVWLEGAYRGLTGLMPPRLAARVDYLRPELRMPAWGNGPLNGQIRRQQAVRRLVAAVPFDEVVETGTFRGASTEFLAALTGIPVYTAENSVRFFEFARRRLGGWPAVRVELTDSRTMLLRLSERRDVGEKTTLFYLDAHWHRDLPLREEVTIVARAWPRAVILIDDFRVPGDPGYGFDDYGPGKRLEASYLSMEELSGWGFFYPSAPSETETGARRGYIALVSPELVPAVSAISELRRG
jgi:hypothetical protein